MKILQTTLATHGGQAAKRCAEAIADWLADHEGDPLANCYGMASVLLTQAGTPRKLETKGLVAAAPEVREKIARLLDWAVVLQGDCAAAGIAARAHVIHGFDDTVVAKNDVS